MASLKKPKKIRLDQLLLERGMFPDTDTASRAILAGEVIGPSSKLTKPGEQVKADLAITHKPKKDHPWVSRGALKLIKGLDHFQITPKGQICIDIGSSTGGFTEVLLSRGAEKVYAVDVGYGELAHKLMQDERVVVCERTNARHLTREIIDEEPTMLVCDASFITLSAVLETPLTLLAKSSQIIVLIKPQFEAKKHEVGEGGIVRDEAVHIRVCDEAQSWLEGEGFDISGITESPIKGTKGNTEFLIAASRDLT